MNSGNVDIFRSGISRLVEEGVFTAAYPLHVVSGVAWQVTDVVIKFM